MLFWTNSVFTTTNQSRACIPADVVQICLSIGCSNPPPLVNKTFSHCEEDIPLVSNWAMALDLEVLTPPTLNTGLQTTPVRTEGLSSIKSTWLHYLQKSRDSVPTKLDLFCSMVLLIKHKAKSANHMWTGWSNSRSSYRTLLRVNFPIVITHPPVIFL